MFTNKSGQPGLTKMHARILPLHFCAADGFWGQMGKVER